MNPQQKGPLDRGIEYTHVYGYATGYTCPITGGCQAKCRWKMADGSIVPCYAERIAGQFGSDQFYPEGFEHHYYCPKRLQEPLAHKKPAGIFLDPMSDLFGSWVPASQIEAILSMCHQAHWHTFFILTKNPSRLRHFSYPPNVWVGISAPPSQMYGEVLTPNQQAGMLEIGLKALDEIDVSVRWLSAEPLAWNVAPAIEHANLQWIVIGPASRGFKVYQPAFTDVRDLIAAADRRGIPVFTKSALRWPQRQEWPAARPTVAAAPQQTALFGEVTR